MGGRTTAEPAVRQEPPPLFSRTAFAQIIHDFTPMCRIEFACGHLVPEHAAQFGKEFQGIFSHDLSANTKCVLLSEFSSRDLFG